MRRLLWIIIPVMLLLAAPVLAQDVTPEPDDPLSALVERMEAAAQRADDAARRAESAASDASAEARAAAELADDAGDTLGLALDMFALFEAMSGIVTLVVPFLAIVAGLIGLTRLESASNELKEARERFENEMRSRGQELDKLRDELAQTAVQQREHASRASLSLSLLPLGERQYRAQDYKGALDTYQRALKLDQANPITHYRLGYVYAQSGQLDQAVHHLTHALDLDPEFAPAQAARGYVYRRMGDSMEAGIERDLLYNQAEENLLKALHAYPKLMDEDGESWWGSLGGLYRRREHIEQAINAYERCAEVTPHSSYPFSNLALLYGQTDKQDKMREMYARVEQLASGEVQAEVDNYWAYADLVLSRLALGRREEAFAVLPMTLSTAPPDSPYALQILMDTMKRLRGFVAAELHPSLDEALARIQAHLDAKAKTASEISDEGGADAGDMIDEIVEDNDRDTTGPDVT